MSKYFSVLAKKLDMVMLNKIFLHSGYRYHYSYESHSEIGKSETFEK